MVHKKYTFKNGKLYGPYFYENKRVGEKVVTTYVGKDTPHIPKKHFKLGVILTVAFILLVAGLLFFKGSPTGNVILDVGGTYTYGELLNGTLKLSLQPGELLPADSEIYIRNGDQLVSIPLIDLISANQSEGDFYIIDHIIAGSGAGFGVPGTKTTYPEVRFELLISTSDTGSDEEEETTTPEDDNDTSGEENTIPPVQESNESDSDSEEQTDEPPVEQVEEPTESDSPDGETPTGSDDSEAGSEENKDKEKESTSNDNSDKEEKEDKADSEKSSDKESKSSEKEDKKDSSDEKESESGSVLTGNVISEDEFTISGTVAKGNDFNYNLESEQSASIVEGSVQIGDIVLNESEISLDTTHNTATVSTEYALEEKGFGADYITDEEGLELSINLSVFGITVQDSNLTIQIFRLQNELLSVSKELDIENLTTGVENETNVTVEPITAPALQQLKSLPTLRLGVNGSAEMNLSEYFTGAERYEFNISDIQWNFTGEMLTVSADGNFTGATQGSVYAFNGSYSIEGKFVALVSSGAINVQTFRNKIVVGEPVQWTKNVTLSEAENVTITLPAGATNVSVLKVDSKKDTLQPALITGNVIHGYLSADVDLGKESVISKFFKRVFGGITGRVIDAAQEFNFSNESVDVVLSDNATNYLITYLTPAPEIVKNITEDSETITITGPDELNYSDVIASSNLSFLVDVEQKEDLKLYWYNYNFTKPVEIKGVSEVDNQSVVENIVGVVDQNDSGNSSLIVTSVLSTEFVDVSQAVEKTSTEPYILQEIPLDSYDLDFDGKIDYVEWVVPHLSSQTFRLSLIPANISVTNITFTGNYSRLTINTQVSPYTNLAGYWPFDIDNASVSYDLSPRGKNGTYALGAKINSSAIYGSSASFNGTGGISVGSSLGIGGGSFTVTHWIKTTQASGQLYTVGNAGGGDGFRFGISSGAIGYLIGNATMYAEATCGGSNINDGNWHMITGIFDRTFNNTICYLDGVITSTSNYAGIGMPIGDSAPSFGKPPCCTALIGSMDEVMIFNTSLTGQQVLDIYNNQSARFVSQGLVDGVQFNISNQLDVSINVTVDDAQRDGGSNISARIGRWDVSQGYNDTGANVVAYYHFDQNYSDSSGNNLHLTTAAGSGGSMNTTTRSDTIPTFITVGSGVTTVMVKAWGAGGSSGSDSGGGAATGGGGGFIQANFTVQAGDRIDFAAGAVDGSATYINFSRSGKSYAWAVSGNGGEGGDSESNDPNFCSGGNGGPGGGTSGTNGANNDGAGGAGGTQTAGGAGGDGGGSGGGGGSGTGPASSTLVNGGARGTGTVSGGSGGSGWYGGGGGEGGHNDDNDGCDGGGGGGGGSSNATNGTFVTNTAGSGSSVANSGDADYSAGKGNQNQNGYVVIKTFTPSSSAPTNSTGIYNGSVGLNGASLSSPTSTGFSNLNVSDFSICSWIKENQLAVSNRTIVSSGSSLAFGLYSSLNTTGYGIGSPPNTFTFRATFVGSDFLLVDTAAHNANEWYYVCVTRDYANLVGGTFRLYVNGVLKGDNSGATSAIRPLSNITVGNWPEQHPQGAYFNGSIEELLIVNKTLSQSEIQELYVKGRAAWDYTPYTNLTQFNATRSVTAFEIKNKTTNILPSFRLFGNNQFYTSFLPINAGSPINFTFSINDIVAPVLNFTTPTPTSNSRTNAKTTVINISSSDIQTHRVFSSIDDDLALWLRFDYVNSTGHPIDNGAYNSTITAVGGAIQDLNGAKFGNAFRIFGNASYLRVQDNMGLRQPIVRFGHNVSRPYGITISAWVKYNGTQTSWSAILSKDSRGDCCFADPYASYRLLATDGGAASNPYFCVAAAGSGNACVGSSTSISSDTWAHVVGMYNGTHQAVFVNGVRSGISALTGPIYSDYLPFTDTAIGSNSPYNPGSYFNGSLDEVMVFGRGLKESEISSLYNAATTQYIGNTTLGAGRHTVTGYALDDGNNVANTETRTFYLDGILQNLSTVSLTHPNQTVSTNFDYNASIVEDNLRAVVVNANGTNFTIYNESTTLFLNFDNRSSLNEAQNVIVDLSPYNHPVDNYDESVNAYNGFFMFNSSGRSGLAYFVNSSCNGITVKNDRHQILGYNSSFTMSYWIYRSALTVSDSSLITQDLNNAGDYNVKGFRHAIVDGNRIFMWSTQNNATLSLYSSVGIQNSTWYHVLVSYNPSPAVGSRMYLNGQLVASDTGYIIPSTTDVGISGQIGGLDCFKGMYDDVIIMNRSVSAAEARQFYDAGLTKLNATVWNIYSNFSNITVGNNTYTVFTKDSLDNWNSTARTFSLIPQSFAFVSPTPNNNAYVGSSNVNVNISATETHLKSLIWNWNGTNFTIYNESLLLLYNFDNRSVLGENGTYVVDMSLNGKNGTVTGAIPGSAGKFDKGLLVNKASAQSINAGVVRANANNSFSISAWVRPNETSSSWKTIAAEGCNGFDLAINGATIQFGRNCGGGFGFTSGGTVSANEWVHLIMTYNTTHATLYNNGVSTASGAATYTPSGQTLYIGSYDGTNEVFNGTIDQVMIFNRSLSAAEAKQIYDSNLYRFNNTQWYLSMNESNLSNALYTYSATMSDYSDTVYTTGSRTVGVNTIPPQMFFVAPTQPNRTIINRTNGYIINASILTNNLRTLTLSWNNTLLTTYNDSLVLFYNFNNRSSLGENATYIVDVSTTGDDAVAVNGARANTTGRYDGAWTFDGTDDYVKSTGTTATDPDTGVTLSAWIRVTGGAGTYRHIISKPTGTSWSNPYAVYTLRLTSGNQLNFYQNGNDIITSTYSSFTADNTWKHVVLTYNKSNATIYINGVVDKSAITSSSFTSSSQPVTIGSRNSADNGEYFSGSIDEAGVWDRVLSAEEVKYLYDSDSNRFNSTNWIHTTNMSNVSQGEYYYNLSLTTISSSTNNTDTRSVGANFLFTYECRTFNISGTYYQGKDLLNGEVVNMSSNTLCHEINAPDTSLDCLGHSIINRSGTTEGIKSTVKMSGKNLTLQNCNISSNPSGSIHSSVYISSPSNAILLRNLNISDGNEGFFISGGIGNVTIVNNTFYNNSGTVLDLRFDAHNFTIANNNFRRNANYNILTAFGARGMLIANNNFINQSSSYAFITLIYHGGGGHYILNNSFSQPLANSIESGVSNVTISNNVINASGAGSGYGIYLFGSSNVTLHNNTVTNSPGTAAFYLTSLNDSVITNNTASWATQHAFYISSGKNLTFLNNTALSNTLTGFYLEYVLNSAFENNTVIGNRNGLYLNSNVNNTRFNYLTLNSSSQDAIVLAAATVHTNNFTNITVRGTNAAYYDIKTLANGADNNYLIDTQLGNYSFAGTSGSKLIFLDSGEGEIRFLSGLNGSGINLSRDISIGTFTYSAGTNRVAFVNGSNIGLNKSANITFYGMTSAFGRPSILKDGRSECVSPFCVNLTALTASTVIFNVTGWSNYTISNDTFVPQISAIHPQNVTYNTTTLDLNYTFAEANLGSCFYSLNAGSNSSPVSCGVNFTGLTAVQGSNTWRVYINDTSGNLNMSSITFFVDSLAPNAAFVHPTPLFISGFNGTNIYANVSSNDTNQHYALADFDRDLILLIRMDDVNSTSNGVVDLSTYYNNATISGATQNNSGKFGKSFSFDGTDDHFVLNSAITPGNSNWTVSAWVRATSAGSLTILSHNSGGPVTSLFGVSGGKINYQNYNGSWDNHVGSATVNDGNWHLLTWINHVNQSMVMYVDGVLDSGPFNSFTTNGGPVNAIGRNWGASYYAGSMDELMITSRSFTPTELAALYNASTTKYQRNFTALTQGLHTLRGHVVDIAGNRIVTDQHNITIDTVVPNINFTNPTPASNTIQTLTNFTVNVSVNDTNGIYGFNNLDRSLVVLLRGDDLNATGHVIDSSGYGNNGTLAGGATTNVSGRFGEGLSFLGSSSVLSLQSGVSTAGNYTISTWFRYPLAVHGSWRTLMRGAVNDHQVIIDSGGVLGVYDNAGSGFVSSSYDVDVLSTGWHHLVAVGSGTTTVFYVDGASVGTSNFKSSSTINYVGNYQGGAQQFGTIDEFAIFNRSLSLAEILALNLTSQNFLVNYTNLGTGNHTLKSYVVDLAGNLNSTEERIIRVNTPPGVSNVTLNSSFGTNKTGENLTVYFNHSDFDGDRVWNITDWRINGTGYAVLNMPFNTNESRTTTQIVRDYSTSNNNGTLGAGTASAVPNWTQNGKVGGAYSFDGINDYIEIPNSASLNPTLLTISIWAKSNNITWDNYGCLVSKRPSYVLHPDINGQAVRGIIINASGSQFAAYGPTPADIRIWHHYLMTFDGSSVTTYIDGVAGTPTTVVGGVNTVDTGRVAIGWDDDLGARHCNQTLDEILIFNRSLSAPQVWEIYQSGINNLSVQRIVSSELSNGQNWSVAVTPNDAWSDGNTLLSNGVIIDSSTRTNCTGNCFYVRNSTGHNKTIFDKFGNVDTKGSITQSSVGSPDGRDLIFKNSAGSNVAWFDDATGNIRLAGTLSTFQTAAGCTPPASSFVIRNSTGQCVSYIDSSGNMWLMGGLTQNALL